MDCFIVILAVNMMNSIFVFCDWRLRQLSNHRSLEQHHPPPSPSQKLWERRGKARASTSELTAKKTVRLIELMCKLWDGTIQWAQRSQTIDATNHFLHVSRHGLDAAAQPIVLGDHPVLLQSQPCKINKKIKYISPACSRRVWMGLELSLRVTSIRVLA